MALTLSDLKTLSLNLALTLGCVNPNIVNPDVTNPNTDSNSNPNPNNCGYESTKNPSRVLQLEVVLSNHEINELIFSISQNCQLTSLGSVSCPMGVSGLGSMNLIKDVTLA